MDQLSLFPTVATAAVSPRGYVSLYDDLLREAGLAHDLAAQCTTREELLTLLQEKLPQASASTRRVNAYKLLERYFPGTDVRTPLAAWWRCLSERERLQLLLYEAARVERLVDDFVGSVLLPQVLAGSRTLRLEVLHAFVTVALLRPDAKSGERLLRLLKKTGWLRVEQEMLHLLETPPSWPVALYCLYREFGDGQAHPFAALTASRLRRLFLLDDRALESLTLQAWNGQHLAYETRLSPVGFSLRGTRAELTAAAPPRQREAM